MTAKHENGYKAQLFELYFNKDSPFLT